MISILYYLSGSSEAVVVPAGIIMLSDALRSPAFTGSDPERWIHALHACATDAVVFVVVCGGRIQ